MRNKPRPQDQDTISQDAVKAFTQAMRTRSTEARVEHHLVNAFGALDCNPVQQHPVASGVADIHLPEYRTTIEVKAPGKIQPGNSERQLHRYVAGIAEEDRAYNGASRHHRYGIVTDGRQYLVFRYDHNGCHPKRMSQYDWPLMDSDDPQSLIRQLQRGPLAKRTARPWANENIYSVFQDLDADMLSLFQERRKAGHGRQTFIRDVGTKFELWLDQMRASGIAPKHVAEQEEMFAKHTFLVATAKCITAALNFSGTNTPPPPDADSKYVGIGSGFTAWLTTERSGLRLINHLWQRSQDYDWSQHKRDVLRNLYQDCIPKPHRRMYGEFYTPDWLAENIATRLLDDEWLEKACAAGDDAAISGDLSGLDGIGVLDPTCGSGTFLYHAARLLANHRYWRERRLEHNDQRIANAVGLMVLGIDIHPVAIEMARTNVRRALRAEPKYALRIALGDCLLTDRQSSSPGQTALRNVQRIDRHSPGGRPISIPIEFAHHPQTPALIDGIVEAAHEDQPLPTGELPAELQTAEMHGFHDQLRTICKAEGDSVWAWWLRSMLHPRQVSQRGVNRILANPPWVTMNNIRIQERKAELLTLAKRFKVQPGAGAGNASNFDIAGVVSVVCMDNFATTNARSAWVLNEAAFRADSWRRWRKRTKAQRFEEIWTQRMSKRPFHGATCGIAIMYHRGNVKKIRQSQWLGDGYNSLTVEPLDTSVLPRPGEADVRNPSPYSNSHPKWFKGAEAAIKSLFRVNADSLHIQNGEATGVTGKSRHRPWKELGERKFSVPNRWIQHLAESQHLHPFAMSPQLTPYIIPNDGHRLANQEEANQEAYWAEIEHVYAEHKGIGKTTAPTLLARQQYAGLAEKAMNAMHSGKPQVFYPKNGTHMKACRAVNIMAEESLYHIVVDTDTEAQYLVSVLNATSMKQAFIETKQAERNFDLNPWRKIPIPRFDPTNPLHVEIADCCIPLESVAEQLVDPTYGVIKQDNVIRDAIIDDPTMVRLNELLRKLLPSYAR